MHVNRERKNNKSPLIFPCLGRLFVHFPTPATAATLTHAIGESVLEELRVDPVLLMLLVLVLMLVACVPRYCGASLRQLHDSAALGRASPWQQTRSLSGWGVRIPLVLPRLWGWGLGLGCYW